MLKTSFVLCLRVFFAGFYLVLAGVSLAAADVNYSVIPMSPTAQVIKGQFAEFILKVDFANGFSSTGGISFNVTGLPDGTAYSINPALLKRTGGVVLKIETTGLSAGDYPLVITASESSSDPIQVNVTLTVKTTNQSSIKFTYNDGTTSQVITSLNVNGQKQLVIIPSALDSSGSPLTLVPTSSNPSVLGVFKHSMGYYEIYGIESGNVTLRATAPDGAYADLPINISVPSNNRITIGLSPQTITNKYTDIVSLGIGYELIDSQWYGSGISGMIGLTNSTLDYYSDPPPYGYGGTFKVDHSQTALGTYLFYGIITTSYGGSSVYQAVAPLTITNDPTYAGLYMPVRSLDSSIFPMLYSMFFVEFYDNAGVLQFSRTHESYEMNPQPMAFIGAIPPGSYKIKFVPMSTSIQPQWYPNAVSATDAELVAFTAGQNAGPLYFFASPVPTATLSVSSDGAGGGSVFSTPSGIDCPASTCSGPFASGSTVTLTAVPNANSAFGGWGGDCSGTAGCAVTMNSAKSVSATFNSAKAQISGVGYTTLAAAYATSFGSTPILLLDGNLGEGLTVTKSVTLKGGYNASFSGLTGLFTNLNSPLTVQSGTLTVDRITVK